MSWKYVYSQFGLGDCTLDNLLWNVFWMTRQLTINIDSKSNSKTSIFLYAFDSVCLLGYLYVYLLCLVYNWVWVYPVTGDYFAIIIIVSLSFSSNISTMKLAYMFILRTQIMDIVDQYRAIDATVAPASRYGRSLLARLRAVKRRALIFWCSFVGGSCVYLGLPLLLPGHNLPENCLRIYGLEPMDESPNYEMAYILVVLSGVMATFVPVNVTILLIVLVGYIEAHVAALTEEYDQLWLDAVSSVPEEPTDAILYGSSVKGQKMILLNKYVKERLNFLVRRHGEFVVLLQRICALFEGIIGFEFFLTMVALCAVLLGGLEDTFLQIPYTIIQLVVDSLVGQRLLDAGSAFEKSVYRCGWENFDASNMKTVQVVLQCAQRPLRLTAGGITTLCYESFMSITKSVYSAYATLSNTMDKH